MASCCFPTTDCYHRVAWTSIGCIPLPRQAHGDGTGGHSRIELDFFLFPARIAVSVEILGPFARDVRRSCSWTGASGWTRGAGERLREGLASWGFPCKSRSYPSDPAILVPVILKVRIGLQSWDNIRVPGLCGEVRDKPGVAPGNVGCCMTRSGFNVRFPIWGNNPWRRDPVLGHPAAALLRGAGSRWMG